MPTQGNEHSECVTHRAFADARVLGQILAAQNLVFALPDAARVGQFYAEILASLPGISAGRVCLGENFAVAGTLQLPECAQCAVLQKAVKKSGGVSFLSSRFACAGRAPDTRVVTVRTKERVYGVFVCAVQDPAAFAPYEPFVHNLADYVAFALENRLQEGLLCEARDELELRVQQRTEELRIANDNLNNDIARRKRVEAELARANHSLRILSYCNQAILHDYEEATLLDEVCQGLVDIAGYRLAWIGWGEQDGAKTVRPVTHAGDEAGYLRLSDVTWSETEANAHPTATAIRTGAVCCIGDISRHATTATWREQSLQCGCYSVVALPLSFEGKVFGCLTAFAGEPNVFDERELAILKELAGDLSLGIAIRRSREAQRQAEERIQRLAAIVESSDDAIIGKNLDEQITSWNKGAEKTYGYTAAEMEGKPISIIVPPEKQAELAEIMARLKRGERVEALESERIRKDGQKIDVSLTISPILDASGQVVGASTIARNITGRRRLEEALRQSEAKYRIVADQTYDFEFWLNPAGEWVYVSPSCERLTGRTPDEFLKDPGLWRRIVHPDDLTIFDQHIEMTERHGATSEVEWRIIHTDGGIRWVGHVCRPIFSEQGEYLGIRGSNRDITDRKAAEQSIALLSFALDNVHEAAILIGEEGRLYYVNEEACQSLGYTREELLGMVVADVDPDFPLERWPSHWQDLKSHGSILFEGRLRKKNGATFPVEISANYFVYDGRGYNLALIRDISERKRTEESLRHRTEELERFERLVIGRELRMRELKGRIAALEEASEQREGQ